MDEESLSSKKNKRGKKRENENPSIYKRYWKWLEYISIINRISLYNCACTLEYCSLNLDGGEGVWTVYSNKY